MKRLVLCSLVVLAACSKNVSDDVPQTAPQKQPSSASAMPTQAPDKPMPSPTPVPNSATTTAPNAPSYKWTKPSSWQDAPNPSTFRLATYKVGAETEVSVAQAGGSLDQNVARWAGQFGAKPEDAKKSEKTVGGQKVVMVELKGTYTPMTMPGAPPSGPKSDQEMIAAIVGDTEPYLFFRMTGPTKEVEGARAEFDQLVGSVTK